MDYGHELTEKELKKLEKRIRDEYYIAQRDTRKKLQDYLQQTEEARKKQKALLDAGKITKKEYKDWCYRHTMVGQRWKDMLNVLAEDYHHASEIALGIAKDGMPDIYAINANYATWDIEHKGKIDTGFTLYNHDTAEYLLKNQRQLMPGPSTKKQKEIDANKNMQWNMQHIQSAVLQGVLQGESPYDVAKRLNQVADMDYRASVRYARTMGTSAQNAGRYESFRRAKRIGVDLTIEWQATLDGRTRHEHRMMHGQRTEVDKPFHTPDGFTIYYPADCTGESDAPQREIWNCRCTLLAWVKGYEGDTVKSSPKMGDLSFEEWQHEKESSFTATKNPVKLKGASVSDQNTNKIVYFNAQNDYSIAIEKFSDQLNQALSEEARLLAEIGTRDEVEWCSLVDVATGKTVHREPGDIIQTGTEFWGYIDKHKGQQVVFMHNHVLDGSLSVPDMELITQSEEIRCVIAVRNDSVKYVAPRNNKPSPYKMLFQIYGDGPDAELVDKAIADFTEGYYEHDGRKN